MTSTGGLESSSSSGTAKRESIDRPLATGNGGCGVAPALDCADRAFDCWMLRSNRFTRQNPRMDERRMIHPTAIMQNESH